MEEKNENLRGTKVLTQEEITKLLDAINDGKYESRKDNSNLTEEQQQKIEEEFVFNIIHSNTSRAIDIFKRNKIDINKSYGRGYTALMYASRNMDLEMVIFLVEYGAKITTSADDGENAMRLSSKHISDPRHILITKYLLDSIMKKSKNKEKIIDEILDQVVSMDINIKKKKFEFLRSVLNDTYTEKDTIEDKQKAFKDAVQNYLDDAPNVHHKIFETKIMEDTIPDVLNRIENFKKNHSRKKKNGK